MCIRDREQMRYDFVIEMNVEEGRYLEQPTVRILLQPLVENAIRYGLGDDEKITIQVFEDISGDWRSLPYWTAVMA